MFNVSEFGVEMFHTVTIYLTNITVIGKSWFVAKKIMAKNSDILKNFELILKENALNQIPVLYSGNKHEKPGNNGSKLSLGVDQVICNVTRQIKAIQSADCRKNNRGTTVNISKYKKSTFIPVSMLDGAELVSYFDYFCLFYYFLK